MVINEKKAYIQEEALKAWIKNDKIGTCEIITGLGKTFLALKALQTFPKYKNDTIHLFLAEQVDREDDLLKDIEKFNKLYNCDIMKEYNLQFRCYQTVRSWSGFKFGLVIADEIHDSISKENCKFYFNNAVQGILGLTAKFNGDKIYDFVGDPDMIRIFQKLYVSKAEILKMVAPIIYTYTINQGQKDDTSRKLNIFIIEHELNAYDKTIKAGNAKKPFFQTEKAAYQYINKIFNEIINKQPLPTEDLYKFEEQRNLELIKIVNKRANFLYSLPSKIDVLEEFLHLIKGKTIIFGNSLVELAKLTPHVVSSKNKDLENQNIRNLFDNGEIDLIGSFKKLKQGANLKDVKNCIIHSYYSDEIDFIQRVGRLRQAQDNSAGNVIILVTKDTQEEVWLNKMLSNANEFNIIKTTLNGFMDNKYYKDM